MMMAQVTRADGTLCDMFTVDLSKVKSLPRNNRATAIYRETDRANKLLGFASPP